MTDDGFADCISLITGRAMVAQKRPSFDGAPVLERQMGTVHMRWGYADVMKETGKEICLQNRSEVREVRLYNGNTCTQSVHAFTDTQKEIHSNSTIYSWVTLTIVPDAHDVIESSLRQRSFRVVEDLLSRFIIRHLHTVKVQLGMFLLVDLLEGLGVASWDGSPSVVGKFRVGITARHRVSNLKVGVSKVRKDTTVFKTLIPYLSVVNTGLLSTARKRTRRKHFVGFVLI